MARESRVGASSIIHHLGSLEHLMRVSALWTGRARRDQLASRWHEEGLMAHLPRTGDHVVEARVWLAWCEMWRAEPRVEPTVSEARDHERALLAGQLDYALPRDDLDSLVAMIDGLTVAVCRPVRPLPPTRARTLLRRAYPGIGPPDDEMFTDGVVPDPHRSWRG